MKRAIGLLIVLCLTLSFILSCQKQPQEALKITQGRVLEFDPNTLSLLIIVDKNNNNEKPDFNTLPPQRFDLSTDIIEKGSEPTGGYRLNLDTQKKQLTLYNPSEQNIMNVDIKILEQKLNVQRDDPLVYDKKTQTTKNYLSIDKTKKIIHLYSLRQRTYLSFQVEDKYINLPDRAWLSGDYVKIAYKEGTTKALKFTNITKTDLLKFKSQ